MSVCEVGATIGRLWREMSDANKQHFNDDFALDKVKYALVSVSRKTVGRTLGRERYIFGEGVCSAVNFELLSD